MPNPRWGSWAVLVLGTAACQMAAGGRGAGRDAAQPPPLPAPVVAPLPPPLPPPVVVEAPAPVVEPMPPAVVSNCPDPPERIAAREGMAQMRAEHDRQVVELGRLRAEWTAAVAEALASGNLPGLLDRTREAATRAGAVPGWHPVASEALQVAAGQAVFTAAVCRAYQGAPDACAAVDRVEPTGSARCDRVSRLLQGWRRLRAGQAPEAVQAELTGEAERARADAIRRAATGADESVCETSAGASAEDWPTALCRGVAARDSRRCDGLPDRRRREGCRALVYALHGERDQGAGTPGALAVAFRRWVDRPEPPADCTAEALAILEAEPALAEAFEPAPLVLPDIEAQRGLAPTALAAPPPLP